MADRSLTKKHGRRRLSVRSSAGPGGFVRAAVITSLTGPESVEVRDVPDPVPEPGQVLVDVEFAGVVSESLARRSLGRPPWNSFLSGRFLWPRWTAASLVAGRRG
jgi:hypothetical protein